MKQEDIVYKILRLREWRQIEQTKKIAISALDKASGFVHLSTREHLLETCSLYFKPEEQPLAIGIGTQELAGDLRWELVPTRNNQAFPHLYRALQFSDFQLLQYFAFQNGTWSFGRQEPLEERKLFK